MQKKILMANTDLRHRRMQEQIGQSCQELIEIDNQIGTGFPNAATDVTHAAKVSRQVHQVVSHTAHKTHPAVGRSRQEVGTQESLHGCLDATVEKSGQTA